MINHDVIINALNHLEIDQCVYNWIINFLMDHKHCTHWQGKFSGYKHINCGVIQGSVLGPALFTIAYSMLQPVGINIAYIKYADDLVILFPGTDVEVMKAEWDSINTWSTKANLTLNQDKSKLVIFSLRHKHEVVTAMVDQMHIKGIGIQAVDVIKFLGITISSNLKAHYHVNEIILKSCRIMYILKIMKCHGMPLNSLHDVFVALIISRLTYAACSWSRLINNEDIHHIDKIICRGKRLGYCQQDTANFLTITENRVTDLYQQICKDSRYILHSLIPPPVEHAHFLCSSQQGNYTLPVMIRPHDDRNYIIWMSYRGILT